MPVTIRQRRRLLRSTDANPTPPRTLLRPRRVDPCSSWVGVGCDTGGRVVSLDLYGLRRTRLGRQNPRFAVEGIQNLTRLASFNATGFTLLGSIPDWFGSRLPPSLAILDLRRTSIYGDIPYSLGGATGLTVLSLAENSVTGSIPPTLGRLRNLSFLDLSRNLLSGDVPAEFTGIKNVTYLDLSSNFITGVVLPEIGDLSKLETLILANNSFTGSIPPELGNVSSLFTLDLSFNSLFGALPDSLSNLSNLRHLKLGSNFLSGFLRSNIFSGLSLLESITLSRNNFSGELPDSLWSLSKLRFLDISYNNFTGSLPELSSTNANRNAIGGSINLSHNLLYGSISSGFAILLSRLSYADISDNYLRGFVPRDGTSRILSVKMNCFQNASSQRTQAVCEHFYEDRGIPYDDIVNENSPPATSLRSNSSKSYNAWKYIVIAVVGGTALLVLVIISVMLCFRRCRSLSSEQRDGSQNASSSIPGGGLTRPPIVAVNLPAVGVAFTFEQLARATLDFGEGNLIKHGKSGDIYHGILENGINVIVKRIDMGSVKKESYMVELDFFASFSHERLVPFVGHCSENENEKFLVYREMPHRDLSNALYRKPSPGEEGLQSLDWITRLKIATGAAEALCFLHHECVPPLVHRTPEQSGTGLPPASCAYDVHCFGKVLLELVTGKLGVSGSNDASTNEWLEHTLRFINIYEKELITKIVDPLLIVDEDLLEEVWAMAIVARSCLNPKSSKRPLMKYILKALENPLKVVRDENNSASGRLKATSSRGSWNAVLFGSWRHSSSADMPSVSAQPRDDRSLRRSGTIRSQGSAGEHSFSRRRPSKDIFPEPQDIEDS
ncbi:putative LRR receptor-like serine/threonine-protein kinase [Dendrobium catenatum]|uniref:non-specific serine/threonine protein kinase n=1 Tax=Dendrobium catenatum TaxID=906689 RepID=A0A2I0X057_9ASPA|nr:putative LRR receptor-like serine/threonine-protein kinase [Dendrobium catenatum]